MSHCGIESILSFVNFYYYNNIVTLLRIFDKHIMCFNKNITIIYLVYFQK
nr:MAG TPA: hypothetical protein [Caudoviricetes sp.]